MFSATRALLDQHIKDCRDDRARTAQNFSEATQKIDKLENKIDVSLSQRERQHQENQAKLDRIMRVIWMGTGGVGLLAFLTSDWGRNLLSMLQHGVQQ